ncbi:AraC family transcriptional regulator [Anaerobium acetethylicum]|uniref:AraC-type DNA-binding protein n=1 Tax=Anaerobium acetethylicum TaxID=1619234 RepID=A0A1D3TVL4_9FIRM|nr:AraC family transcriptional regulator [Anaerobium acetethylicum]SCP98183.1 AraC-type DNA-binding protein [Anaerobium acetethylicum]
MNEFTSCKAAIAECNEKQRFAIAHLYNEEKTMNMHIHDCYEIYYSISGGKQFLIDNKFYAIQPGSLFFINQYESHYLSQIDQMVHERIVISIHPEFLKKLSSDSTDLGYCFTHRSPEAGHRVDLNDEQQKRFLYFLHKITGTSGYGSDLTEQAAFTELMIMLNTLFYQNCRSEVTISNYQYNHQVGKILEYINQNIDQNVTIERLSREFYLSESYICRIFKAETGTTINKYLTARRISIAKSLLATGNSVSEVYEKCGFNDYSNFLKSFTKAVGISPKKYGKYSAT